MKLDPLWFALVGTGVLVAVGGPSIYAQTEASAAISNILIAFAILAICLSTSALLFIQRGVNFLSPIPWFYLVCSLYFGVGPLAMPFASAETSTYINFASGYPIGETGIFETNVLNAAGLFVATAAMFLGRALFPWENFNTEAAIRNFDISSAGRVFWSLVAVGGLAKYIIGLPSALGLIKFTVPGLVLQMQMALPVAIIIGMLLVQKGAKSYLAPLTILISMELLTSLIVFSKTATIIVFVAIVLGRALWQNSIRFLAGALVAVALLYALVLSPFVAAARLTIGTSGSTDIAVVMEELGSHIGLRDKSGVQSTDDLQPWWSRLNYSNYEKFGIDQYNEGIPGRTFRDILFVFVPRILYPNKPVMNYGRELSDLMNPGSGEWVQTAMGLFAEGYWNFGILGLLLVGGWTGLVLAGFTRFAYEQLARGRLAMIVVCWMGVLTGLEIGWWVSTYVGGVGLIALIGLALWYVFYRGDQQGKLSLAGARTRLPT